MAASPNGSIATSWCAPGCSTCQAMHGVMQSAERWQWAWECNKVSTVLATVGEWALSCGCLLSRFDVGVAA
jgi:hypothetical protein